MADPQDSQTELLEKGQGEWSMTRTGGHTCLPDHSARLGVVSAGWDSARPQTLKPAFLLFLFPLLTCTPGPIS